MKKIVALVLIAALVIFPIKISENKAFAVMIGDYTYNVVTGTDDIIITGYTGVDEDLVIPDTIDGYTVVEVGANAFKNHSLRSVVIPDTVTKIGDRAFECSHPCEGLESVTFPTALLNIEQFAFSGNVLTSITIPNTVTTIGQSAFYDNRLQSVTLPDGLSILATSVFEYNLLESIAIPDTVTTIGSRAFRDNQLTEIQWPAQLVTIHDRAFSGNSLTSIDIVDTVTSIGDYAFSTNNLTDVALSNSLTSLGEGAFFMNYITSVTLPSTLTVISESTFSSNNISSLIIPDSITVIGENAFHSNLLETLIIPESVEELGEGAFQSNLIRELSLPEGLLSLGNSAFAYNKLTDYYFPSTLLAVGNSVYQFNLITSATLSIDTVTARGQMFSSNEIVDAMIENGVTEIPHGYFSNNKMESIIIPNTVTSINFYAFYNNALSHVTIPDSVTMIEDYAFARNSLETITFGSGITSLSDTVISDQSRLGYEFDGWYSDEAYMTAWDFTNSPADQTLYAKYNKLLFDVTFDSDGGSAVAALSDIAYDEKALMPSAPTKSGYRFDGWYSDSSLTNEWDFSVDTVTEDITLYAKWIKRAVNNYTPPVVDEPTPSQEPKQPLFLDIKGHAAETSITKLAEQNILNGYGDGNFGPDDRIQRHHLALIIDRVLKVEATRGEERFDDIPESHPSFSAIQRLQQAGILDGYSGKFNPNREITLAEIAKVLVSAYAIEPIEAPEDGVVRHWSYSYTEALVKLNIMSAEQITDELNEPVTRGTLAIILEKLLTYKGLIK